MSNLSTLRTLGRISLAAALGLIFAACDFSGLSSLEDDLEISLDIPGVNSTVALQLVDQRTGLPIQGNASVEVGGRDGGLLFDPLLFEPVESTSTSSGLVVLGLNDSRTPSGAQPVVFDVFVSSPGFVETTSTVVLDRTGLQSGEVALVNVSDPPPGVMSVMATGTAAPDGRLLAPISATTPKEPTTGAAASLQIAGGTVLSTAQGQPLSGTISASVAYFNDASLTSLSAFPGGLSSVEIQGGSSGSFITGGFVSISVEDGQGRRASNLSQAADVALAIAPGTINPLTRQPVRAGDELPIWSLEPRSGEWRSEGVRIAQSTTAALAEGGHLPQELLGTGLVTRFSTDHLSYFNIDWFTTDNCGFADGTRFQLDRAPSEPLRLEIFQRGFWSGRDLARGSAGREVTVFGFPRDMSDVSWRLVRLSDRSEVGSGQVSGQLCGVQVPVTTPEPASRLIVDLEVAVVCPSGGRDVVLRPSYPAAYRPEGSSRWTWSNLQNGRVVLEGLEYGARYEVGFNVKRGNSWSFETRTITLSEAPGSGLTDPSVQFVEGSRDGDRLNIRYRISGVQAICDAI